MSAKEVAEAMEQAFHEGDWQQLAALLTDDFAYKLSPSQAIDKQQVIFFGKILLDAFPNRSYNLRDFEQISENQVKAVQSFSGDHTGTLDLSFMGVPAIPPTGKHVTLPEEHLTYTIEGDKVKMIESVSQGEGGLPVILAQLGVPMPQA